MSEVRLQCSGSPDQVAEFDAAAEPTEAPTAGQLTSIYKSMLDAGWKPRQTL